jgi:pimeloyl-ACP methyl ester carboxylesterase
MTLWQVSKFFVGLTMFGAWAQAEVNLPGRCFADNAHAIDRGHFTYRYTMSAGSDHSAPTIIFIPGGPGQTSTDIPLGVPSEMSLIRTDPRGVGCNQSDALTDKDLTSEGIARDILAIVRDQHLTRYILHGVSFGTVVATMAAALANSENTPPPMAVVLEGTIGRAFHAGEYDKAFITRWQRLRRQIPDRLRAELDRNELPLGVSSREMASWISALTIFAEMPTGRDFGLFQLQRLDRVHEEPDDADNLRRQIHNLTAKPNEGRMRLHKNITCHELVPDMRDVVYDFDLKNGELVDSGLRLCDGVSLDRPFDSANYQISAPIYYFSGLEDPATPPFQARYHFENQKTVGQRTLVTIKDGGHQAFSNTLGDCTTPIWRAIASGNSDEFDSALQTCTLIPKITTKRI